MSKINIWVAIWVFLLSLTWLIPNHYQPWTSFHSDAWVAIISALASLPLVTRKERLINWPSFAVVTLLLCFVPWAQYAVGMLAFASQAWIASIYLLGFTLAIVIGTNLESRFPGALPDALLAAVTMAAVASVGLSLGSWAEVIDTGLDGYLSMGYSGGRHYANLGQPNMLASLLLWGLVGCLWAYTRGGIGICAAVIIGIFIILGLVLTQSRMAYVASAAAVIVLIIHCRSMKLSILLFLCSLYFGAFILGVSFFQWMDSHFFQREAGGYVRSAFQGDIRLTAWTMFLDAIWERPWAGYGWTEVVNAQIEVAYKFPSLGGMFGHTHNMVLDLFIWLGVPLALVVVLFAAGWLLFVIRKIGGKEDLLLLLLLLVIGVHSMFEYPLQYATFLIPSGMIVGVICSRVSNGYTLRVGRFVFLGLLVVVIFLLSGLIRDYLRVEESYNKWRFERAGLVYPKPEVPEVPEVVYLIQFKYWLEMVRIRPNSEMTGPELALREKVVRAYPSPGAIYELALAYALNKNSDAAIYWLSRLCKLASDRECLLLKGAWELQRKSNQLVDRVIWPVE